MPFYDKLTNQIALDQVNKSPEVLTNEIKYIACTYNQKPSYLIGQLVISRLYISISVFTPWACDCRYSNHIATPWQP